MKRYLLARTRKSLPIVYSLVLGIVCILFYPISYSENSSAWIGGYVLAPILCAFVLKNILKDVFALNRQLAALGDMDGILSDFDSSEKTIGGNLQVGKKYLFGKGSFHIVAYSDIQRIGMENADRKGKLARDLWYTDLLGEKHFICELDPMGQSHLELDSVYRVVEKKNPNSETGL